VDLSLCQFRRELYSEMNTNESRIAYYKIAPEGLKHLLALEGYLRQCGLEKSLLELVKLRASQINGCAYCIDMHSKDALAAGETTQRLVALDAWRETPFYTGRERAALAWCETLTRISETHAPDEAFQAAREHFDEAELVNLTLAISSINSWNRISLAFRTVPGSYQPHQKSQDKAEE
jgi:AhpD family alkylhydroperoxidase